MRSRLPLVWVPLAVLLALCGPAFGQQNPYRLKEPDQKKACLACHTEFGQKLAKRFVHTPVRTGECSGCHDPHVSSHAKLLAGNPRQVCAECHDSVIPRQARSVHKIVADGECRTCHDPHASDHAAALVERGEALCFSCHKELGEAIGKAKFKHNPVAQGCLGCHVPHGSDKAASLLTSGVPGLCVGCHKPETPAFLARHMNYPVGKASCTSCHDPHGSNQPALLLNTVHGPVANRTCNACHEPSTSATPFATKRPGFELCKGCHADMVNATMAKRRLHWPVADRRSCANCHNPHAAKYDKLLVARDADLCGNCHGDTLKRIAGTAVKHEPAKTGACTACHSPHGADGVHLVAQPSVNQLCTTCHDYETHSAHPIGEKAVDPRNKNLRVDCLSCHNGHGTAFKKMLLTETNVELCTRCHKQYGR